MFLDDVRLRVHRQGSDNHDNVRIGMNATLETIKPAVLLENFAIFGDDSTAREYGAARHSALPRDLVTALNAALTS